MRASEAHFSTFYPSVLLEHPMKRPFRAAEPEMTLDPFNKFKGLF